MPIIPESRHSPTDQKPEDSGSEVDITLLSPVSPEIGCNLLISSSLRERTDKVLLLVDQNPERNSFNLPLLPLPSQVSVCSISGKKIKQLQSGQTQHIKSTRDVITWQGNECPNRTSHAQIRRPLIDQIIRLIHEKSRTLTHPNQFTSGQISDFHNFVLFRRLRHNFGQLLYWPGMSLMNPNQLNYSDPSNTGNLHNSDSIIEGYQYSMPNSIKSAFESLLS